MVDDLEELGSALKRTSPPPPRQESREKAISRAVAHFDKLQPQRRQGLRIFDRLMIGKAFPGRRSMQHRYALAGSVSLAVLALAIVNIAQFETVRHSPVKPGETSKASNTNSTPPVRSSDVSQNTTEVQGRIADSKSNAKAVTRDDGPAPLSESDAAFDTLMLREKGASIAAAPETRAQYNLQHSVDEMSGQFGSGYHDQGRDKFTDIVPNPVKVTAEQPVSTFSIDVDTSSYSFVRASLNSNVLPQKDAVRVEELVNYFPYDYPSPEDRAEPFKATVSVFPTPWNPSTKLMHIGIKGFTIDGKDKPPANLVFLIDTSGSMDEPNKLPLLRNAMKMLVESLDPDNKVAIVTYAGNAGTILAPTEVKDKAKILAALDSLNSAGSTAGAEGIRQAYQLAEQNFNKLGINRVILATDGDFNVGITDPEELKSFVERKRDTGIYLSVLGFGMGNYNDELMQTLAQNGNGNAAYIDNLNEARKALVDGANAMLFPIAKDVKIQIEFNPQTVSEYRLIGYETRLLNREDFNNDKVDAGDIGAGHAVTALYEIAPKNSPTLLNDPLRYQSATRSSDTPLGNEYAFLKIRYKLPDAGTSRLISTPITRSSEVSSVGEASKEAQFATAVSAFGQLLRGGQYTGTYSYDDVIALARSAQGADEFGYRSEFVNLVRLAKTAQTLDPLKQ